MRHVYFVTKIKKKRVSRWKRGIEDVGLKGHRRGTDSKERK